MKIKEALLLQTKTDCVAELLGAIIGRAIGNVVHSCVFIFASNVIFHTNFNYGWKEILAFYVLVVTYEGLKPKKFE